MPPVPWDPPQKWRRERHRRSDPPVYPGVLRNGLGAYEIPRICHTVHLHKNSCPASSNMGKKGFFMFRNTCFQTTFKQTKKKGSAASRQTPWNTRIWRARGIRTLDLGSGGQRSIQLSYGTHLQEPTVDYSIPEVCQGERTVSFFFEHLTATSSGAPPQGFW